MRIEDRLRSGLPEAAGDPQPSADLWQRVERGVVRHQRRVAVGRAAAVTVALAAFAAIMVWLGISFLGGTKGRPASPTPPGVSPTVTQSRGQVLTTFVPSRVVVLDAGRLVAVGTKDQGCQPSCTVVAVSEDGGTTWRLSPTGDEVVNGVTAAPGGGVWATSGTCVPFGPADCTNRILYSSNGDAPWDVLGRSAVRDPTFGDGAHGWALSGHAVALTPGQPIARTTDGGRTWTDVPGPCPDPTPFPTGIFFADPDQGWVACVGDAATIQQGKAVMATSDGGQTWAPMAEVFAPGAGATVGDGGLPLAGHSPGVTFLPDGHGWLWLDRDCLYGTPDGGRSWTQLGVCRPDIAFVLSASLVDDQTGYVLVRDADVGQLLLKKTTDGGLTFTDVADWPIPG